MARKTPLSQTLMLVVIALVVMVLSIGSTLYFSGVPIGDFGTRLREAVGGDYKHSTMTDARMTCEQRLRKSFKDRIRVMHVDGLSSRPDEAAGQYKIFIEAQVYADSDRQGETREMFISCFTDMQSGKIDSFQFAGDSEGEIGPDGEPATNYFGL